MQIGWNLSKLVTNALVNFGNFFNYLILSPLAATPSAPLSAQEIISSENAVQEEWAMPVCLRDNDKNLGESFAWDLE